MKSIVVLAGFVIFVGSVVVSTIWGDLVETEQGSVAKKPAIQELCEIVPNTSITREQATCLADRLGFGAVEWKMSESSDYPEGPVWVLSANLKEGKGRHRAGTQGVTVVFDKRSGRIQRLYHWEIEKPRH